jgi:putative addiction module CopG family antidote
MEVQLTPDQKAFIKQGIETGRFQHENDAVQEALSLWEERERRRVEFLESLNDAKASLARGEGRVIAKQSMRDLSEEVKARGRVRLASEQPGPR